MKKLALAVVGILAVAAVLYVVLVPSKSETPSSTDTVGTPPASDLPAPAPGVTPQNTPVVKGRYIDYSEATVKEAGYTTTILFFHAPWCPECRGFDAAINESGVPNGIQILKVDYDSAADLKQRYGVTIQTTFVRIASSGDKQKLWTGYGKEKSVDAILENTK